MAGLLHRTAQPPTLAAFRPWEGSAGAGRVRPAGAKILIEGLFSNYQLSTLNSQLSTINYHLSELNCFDRLNSFH